MAFWVSMLILILMFVVFFGFIVKKKPIKKLLLGYLGVLVGYFFLVDFACGPNSHDVKIMKPQAKAIAEDIVKNGVPTSLGDILDLPYKIQNCIRSNNGYTDKEICYFYVDKITYEIILLTSNSWSYYLHITAKTKTRVSAFFRKDSSEKWILDDNEIEEYSTNHSGICSNFGKQ